MLPRRFFTTTLLLVCSAGLHGQMARQHRPMPQAGPYHVLRADLHMHTVFSDGYVWPTTRVLEAWQEGLDVLSITDHDDYRPKEKDVNMDLERPYQIARPLAEALGLLLIPGVEITKGDIHFNALFVTNHNAFRGKPLQEALAEAKRQGAYTFWNHPGWKGPAEWWPPIATAYSDKLFQGIELINGPVYYPEAHPWIEKHGLAIIGNSDIHTPSVDGETRTLMLILAKEKTLDGVREALNARRTIAWQEQKTLYGPAEVLDLLFRAAVKFPRRVTVLRDSSNGIPIENGSSVAFQVKIAEAPAWLETGPVRLGPASATILRYGLKRDAPAGPQQVKLRLVVTNTLTGPGQHLEVPVEFTLER
jgi:predicted metal-dependent phosphoesterase TrpH